MVERINTEKAMDVHVMGVAVYPPAERIVTSRLEEIVYETARAALDDAGIKRAEIDHVTIAASDELDGRAISSMLLAMPAGAHLRDETKCTDSGLTGLCLGAMRVASGVFDLGLVVSWNKTSESPIENVMRMRGEPFYTRPIGLNMAITDGLFAGAVEERYGITADKVDAQVRRSYARARSNPRGLRRTPPSAADLAASAMVASPLRERQRAPITDGAVALVIASPRWVARSGGRRSLARITGLGWRSEQYQLGGERLAGLAGFRGAVDDALKSAGGLDLAEIDLVELDAQTGYYHLAFAQALGGEAAPPISPGGGAFAHNPYFCNGLVNAAEAVLQVSGRAGVVQVPSARRALAHGAHGYAQQGNVAVVVEGM